jgi:rhodanese-related sulfurtransferase
VKQKIIVGIILALVIVIAAVFVIYYTAIPEGLPTTYQDLTPAGAKALIDNNPDLIVIDVSPAYAEGHLPRAVNYYVGDGTLDATIPSLDPEAMYLVYCHVESASRTGAQKLIDAGFTNVYRLNGEYDAWVEAGYPIE